MKAIISCYKSKGSKGIKVISLMATTKFHISKALNVAHAAKKASFVGHFLPLVPLSVTRSPEEIPTLLEGV